MGICVAAPGMGLQINQIIKSFTAKQAHIVLDRVSTFFVSFHRQSTSSRKSRALGRRLYEKRARYILAKLASVLVANADVMSQVFPRVRLETAFPAPRLSSRRRLSFPFRVRDEEVIITITGLSEGTVAPLASVL